MSKFTIKPSRSAIFYQGGLFPLLLFVLPFAYWIAKANPSFLFSSDVIFYFLFWSIFLGLSGYMVFRFVVQSWYAEVSFDGTEIKFDTVGDHRKISLQDIGDCAFFLFEDLPMKKSVGDSFHFLRRDNSGIIMWKIRCGWKKADAMKFENVVREMLANKGIKQFPLFEETRHLRKLDRS